MRVLRTLESLGAAVMREGVYLLPDTPANRQSLEALADYVLKSAGGAHVLHVQPASTAQQEGFVRLFDRSARYEELIKTVESLRVGYGQTDPSAISRVLHKQRREFEAITALDFFPSPARERAQGALARAEAEVKKLLFSARTQAELGAHENLLARVWATRKPLWADRLACAWLIRRFIDPEARLVWLDKGEAPPPEAIGFGFEGAHFANSEARVSYEEMLERLKLAKNAALAKIGSIVHFLEVRGAPVAEAAGVQTLLQGAVRRSPSEKELLAEAEKTFDLLYEAYYEPAARILDDRGGEAELARIERSPGNAKIGSEAANVNALDAARLEIAIKPRARLLVGFDKRRIAIHFGVEPFADDELCMRDGQALHELCALRALHTMIGPENLGPIRQLDDVERLFAWVRRSERDMPRCMPVLGENNVLKTPREAVHQGNDLVALRHGEATSGYEAVLHVDDDERITAPRLDLVLRECETK
jgi:hypothetical protein